MENLRVCVRVFVGLCLGLSQEGVHLLDDDHQRGLMIWVCISMVSQRSDMGLHGNKPRDRCHEMAKQMD